MEPACPKRLNLKIFIKLCLLQKFFKIGEYFGAITKFKATMKKLFLMLVFVIGFAALIAQQRTSVNVSDLPKAITDYITKDYSGFTISKASKVDENNVVTYETVITKGSLRDVLSFDSSGNFLKKIQAAGGMKKMSHPGSSAKPAPKN